MSYQEDKTPFLKSHESASSRLSTASGVYVFTGDTTCTASGSMRVPRSFGRSGEKNKLWKYKFHIFPPFSSQSFNEPYRRHDWHSPEFEPEPLLGVITDDHRQQGEGSPVSPTEEAEASCSKPSKERHEDQAAASKERREDQAAARIQHARMQGVVYVTGRSKVTSKENSSWFRR
jgi:hypothetical protein